MPIGFETEVLLVDDTDAVDEIEGGILSLVWCARQDKRGGRSASRYEDCSGYLGVTNQQSRREQKAP